MDLTKKATRSRVGKAAKAAFDACVEARKAGRGLHPEGLAQCLTSNAEEARVFVAVCHVLWAGYVERATRRVKAADRPDPESEDDAIENQIGKQP